jgi:carboxymethylenebutenolidase
VVLHEVFGLTDDIRQQADRLAAAGFLAVAPDLYSAGGARRCLVSTFRALTSGTGAALGDIEAVRSYVAAHPRSTGKVGVVGFCMGGGFALLAATRGFDAAAPSYGPLPRQAEQALVGACPVVGSYGARDLELRGAAGKLERALTAAGVPHDVKEYPGVGHSFMNRHDLGPFAVLERVTGFHYDHDAAEDAWNRILRFLAEHLAT